MTRVLTLLCLMCAFACSGTDRPVGTYTPELGEAGAAGQPAGSAPPELRGPLKSSGCGLPLPAKQVASMSGTGYANFEVDQTGATLTGTNPELANVRQFYVHVPSDYDPNRPYRIVYVTRRGCDGLGADDSLAYDMSNEALGGSEQAVYVDVAAPALDMDPRCYDTGTGSESLEYEAFDLIHTFVESHYCVDNNEIFVAGPSQGGAISNMWGCYFGGIPDPPRKFAPKWAIRGHAVMAGWREANEPMPCGGPGAAIWIQESGDLESGDYGGSNPSALQVALATNGCTGNYYDGPKEPWGPATNLPGLGEGACQIYTGCSSQSEAYYPLVFCSVPGSGGSSRADLAIPAFTKFFDLVSSTP
jgi:hypothetical protein